MEDSHESRPDTAKAPGPERHLRGDHPRSHDVVDAHRPGLPELRQQIGDDVALADESEIKRLFPDCALGAVPAVGECYDLEVIVDDSIQAQPDVYLEGGDHATLIHISQAQFSRLMSGARHGRFSTHD